MKYVFGILQCMIDRNLAYVCARELHRYTVEVQEKKLSEQLGGGGGGGAMKAE